MKLLTVHGMVEFEKWRASAHRVIEISSVLRRSAHVVPRDQDRVMFYFNSYIDWDQFNQLYDPDWHNKGIHTKCR